MKERIQLHPIFWAWASVLFLWASNAENLRPQQVFGVAAFLTGGSVLLTVFFSWLFKCPKKGGIVATVIIILFCSYGRAFEALVYRWQIAHCWIHLLVGIVWGGIGCFVAYLMKRRTDVRDLSIGFNVSGVLIVLLVVFRIPFSTLASVYSSANPEHAKLTGLEWPTNNSQTAHGIQNMPDVYYIILDGYARNDVLKTVYGYDNSRFSEWLTNRGFYLANESAANYPMTHFSLPSSLNMQYLDKLMERLPENSTSQLPFFQVTRNPLVGRIFQSHGYRFIHFATNFRGTEDSDIADEVISYRPVWFQNEFMQVFLRTTAARSLCVSMADVHLNEFRRLSELPKQDGPKFVFAHFVLPHHPYVFDAAGHPRPDVLMDMDFNQGTGGWWHRQPYIDQLKYTTDMVMKTVETIQANSRIPPIIIIQSDHGSASTIGKTWRNFKREVFIRERLPILNAYCVPPSIRSNLYPSISPVNSFRVVCNALFDAHYPLLPDRNYMTWYQIGNRLVDVTDTVRKGAPTVEMVSTVDKHDSEITE